MGGSFLNKVKERENNYMDRTGDGGTDGKKSAEAGIG
jgi:hypothetical protein